MSPSDYDDDGGPFSPSGDLEDDSLLDEVLMESYDDDDKGAEEDSKTNTFEDMDDDVSDEAEDLEDADDLTLDTEGR